MDRRTAGKIGGLTAWDRDREGKLADATKGGHVTAERHGRAHYVRMRARQLEVQAEREAGLA